MRNVGLDCYAVSAHMNLGNKGVLETFKGRMNFATELGAKIIISNAALRGEDKAFFDNIERIEEQANDLDLVVALENPGDGRENILNCAKEGAQIIRRLGVPWIRLNYDFGNVISHFNGVVRPEFDFQDAIDYTAHYHIKDVTGDEAGWHFTEVGTGSIDWSMILPTLVDSDIPFSLEVPLRFMRLRDGSTKRSTVPVDLEEIKRILSGSLAFVQSDRG